MDVYTKGGILVVVYAKMHCVSMTQPVFCGLEMVPLECTDCRICMIWYLSGLIRGSLRAFL